MMEPWVIKSVEEALNRLVFGEIRLIIHERQVVGIDTIERRLEKEDKKVEHQLSGKEAAK